MTPLAYLATPNSRSYNWLNGFQGYQQKNVYSYIETTVCYYTYVHYSDWEMNDKRKPLELKRKMEENKALC